MDTDKFRPPPEAPVFRPSAEEFQDPIVYLEGLRRKIGDKYGICKIIPPASWSPPFAVDPEQFRFSPRIQKLNELEAQSRVKLNFLDHLAKFWDLQGKQMKIPLVEQKYLDLYKLQKVVREEGGYEEVTKEKRWGKVVRTLGYPCKKIGFVIRKHYERILYPYDIFLSGATCNPEIIDQQPTGQPACSRRRVTEVKDTSEVKCKVEVKDVAKIKTEPVTEERLTRSRVKGTPSQPTNEHSVKNMKQIKQEPGLVESKRSDVKEKNKKHTEEEEEDSYYCRACGKDDHDDLMLLCDGMDCEDAYHTYCLIPPLASIPPGDWRCPNCLATECKQTAEVYGFEQSQKEYTLKAFGKMADQFKREYFKKPLSAVTSQETEREFWDLVKNLEKDVSVKYGADIHVSECGSGFPTDKTINKFPDAKEYVTSAWNLNNLPTQSSSVLRYISADISGMKVPWCYVGMCFSSFAWHIEDHWSYSVNYLHWGEPKTWYGVPEGSAVKLEECMKHVAPELFEQSPDLLHQLTTIVNPNVIMDYGIPIHRMNQCAGEFMITFPRAYHAGFNQGFNFAEAVNFCPADWLSLGRQCIESYRQIHRQCVFSHDELLSEICKAADTLDLDLAKAVYADLVSIVDREMSLRDQLVCKGMKKQSQCTLESLDDDSRQCDHCKTTLYLSAVKCVCNNKKLVCIDHVDKLCPCPSSKHTLLYRFTVGEMKSMLCKLKKRCKALDDWTRRANALLNSTNKNKPDVSVLRAVISEARDAQLPETETLHQISEVVRKADECIAVVNQLTRKKIRTRGSEMFSQRAGAKISMSDLKDFNTRVNKLSCSIAEATELQSLVESAEMFDAECSRVLSSGLPTDLTALERLIDSDICRCLDFPRLSDLKQLLSGGRWLKEAEDCLTDISSLTVFTMKRKIETGTKFQSISACKVTLKRLQDLLSACLLVEKEADLYLNDSISKPDMRDVEKLLKRADDLGVQFDSIETLREIVEKGLEWKSKVNELMGYEHKPHLLELETLSRKGSRIPVHMTEHDELITLQDNAKAWIHQFSRTINDKHTLIHTVVQDAERVKCVVKGNSEEVMCSFNTELEEVEQQMLSRLNSRRSLNRGKSLGSLCCICCNHTQLTDHVCSVCKLVYHGSKNERVNDGDLISDKCLTRLQHTSGKSLDQSQGITALLCPDCQIRDTPTLSAIQSLNRSYECLGLCITQGRVLAALIDRLEVWLEGARKILDQKNVVRLMTEHGKLTGKKGAGKGTKGGGAAEGSWWRKGGSVCVEQGASSKGSDLGVLSEHDYYNVTELATLNEEEIELIEQSVITGSILQTDTIELNALLHVLLTNRQVIDMNRMRKLQIEAEEEDENCSVVENSSLKKKRKSKLVPKPDVVEREEDELISAPLETKRLRQSSRQSTVASTLSSSSLSSRARVKKSGLDDVIESVARGQQSGKQKKRMIEQSTKSVKKLKTDELCSVETCLQPKGTNIDWIQCDRCELWYHLYCLGLHLTSDQISSMDYVCRVCEQLSLPSSLPPPSTTPAHVKNTRSAAIAKSNDAKKLTKPVNVKRNGQTSGKNDPGKTGVKKRKKCSILRSRNSESVSSVKGLEECGKDIALNSEGTRTEIKQNNESFDTMLTLADVAATVLSQNLNVSSSSLLQSYILSKVNQTSTMCVDRPASDTDCGEVNQARRVTTDDLESVTDISNSTLDASEADNELISVNSFTESITKNCQQWLKSVTAPPGLSVNANQPVSIDNQLSVIVSQPVSSVGQLSINASQPISIENRAPVATSIRQHIIPISASVMQNNTQINSPIISVSTTNLIDNSISDISSVNLATTSTAIPPTVNPLVCSMPVVNSSKPSTSFSAASSNTSLVNSMAYANLVNTISKARIGNTISNASLFNPLTNASLVNTNASLVNSLSSTSLANAGTINVINASASLASLPSNTGSLSHAGSSLIGSLHGGSTLHNTLCIRPVLPTPVFTAEVTNPSLVSSSHINQAALKLSTMPPLIPIVFPSKTSTLPNSPLTLSTPGPYASNQPPQNSASTQPVPIAGPTSLPPALQANLLKMLSSVNTLQNSTLLRNRVVVPPSSITVSQCSTIGSNNFACSAVQTDANGKSLPAAANNSLSNVTNAKFCNSFTPVERVNNIAVNCYWSNQQSIQQETVSSMNIAQISAMNTTNNLTPMTQLITMNNITSINRVNSTNNLNMANNPSTVNYVNTMNSTNTMNSVMNRANTMNSVNVVNNITTVNRLNMAYNPNTISTVNPMNSVNILTGINISQAASSLNSQNSASLTLTSVSNVTIKPAQNLLCISNTAPVISCSNSTSSLPQSTSTMRPLQVNIGAVAMQNMAPCSSLSNSFLSVNNSRTEVNSGTTLYDNIRSAAALPSNVTFNNKSVAVTSCSLLGQGVKTDTRPLGSITSPTLVECEAIDYSLKASSKVLDYSVKRAADEIDKS